MGHISIGKKSVEVQLLFIGDFTSDFNPLVGVVHDEVAALDISQKYPEYNISWETIAVDDSSQQLEAGAPLWLLVQGGAFTDTAFSHPSPVALYSSLASAEAERKVREQKYKEDLLLWKLHLGELDFSTPDWTYRAT